MKKSSIRAFGIACFLIGVLLTMGNHFNIPLVTSTDSNEKQYKEKISELEQQLEVANKQLSKVEQKESTTVVQSEEPQSKPIKEADEPNEVSKKEDVVTGTLYIYSGLTSAEVAQKLKDLGVINNSVEMELFLAQPEYAKSIQKGQFELNSSMSIEEIANIITGKPQE